MGRWKDSDEMKEVARGLDELGGEFAVWNRVVTDSVS